MVHQRIWNSGVACIAIASAVYSIASALVRPLSPGMPVLEIVAVRSALSLLFSVGAHAANGGLHSTPFFGSRENYVFLAARGLIGAAAMDCFYVAVQHLPLGDAVSLLFLNPAITALLAAVLLSEPLGWRGVLGCFSSFLGMLFVVRPPFLFSWLPRDELQVEFQKPWSEGRTMGTIFGILSAILAAGAYLAIRRIGEKETSLTIAAWFHSAAVTHSVVLLVIGRPQAPMVPSILDWLCLTGIAISSFLANILLNRGFQLNKAAIASSVNYTQVVYTHLIGAFAFGEQVTWLGAAGTGLIAVGIICVAIDVQHQKKVRSEKGIEINELNGDNDQESIIGLLDTDHESQRKTVNGEASPPQLQSELVGEEEKKEEGIDDSRHTAV